MVMYCAAGGGVMGCAMASVGAASARALHRRKCFIAEWSFKPRRGGAPGATTREAKNRSPAFCGVPEPGAPVARLRPARASVRAQHDLGHLVLVVLEELVALGGLFE